MSTPLAPPLLRLVRALAREIADEHLTEERQRLQQLARDRTKPVPLPPLDQAA